MDTNGKVKGGEKEREKTEDKRVVRHLRSAMLT